MKLRTYTSELVKPYRTTVVEVSHEGTKNRLPLLVVKGNVPMLLGQNWLKKVKLDWRTMFPFCKEEAHLKSKELLTEFKSVFGEEMGCLKDFKVKIPMDKTMKPRFCQASPVVPYAIKAGVEKELDCLENQGIFKTVEYSRWAAPIVPVVKNDNGDIRICGDCKQTVNAVAPFDSYPIPQIEDIFAMLRGGQKFSKLDLSQLELDEELLTVTPIADYTSPPNNSLGCIVQLESFKERWIRG